VSAYEFSPIRQRLRELEANRDDGELTRRLTDSYILSTNPIHGKDGHTLRLHAEARRHGLPGTVAMMASVAYDGEGNFTGLVPKTETTLDGHTYTRVLRIWVEIPSESYLGVMVDYDVDGKDASKGRIVYMEKSSGRDPDSRTTVDTQPEEWTDLAAKAHLPDVIDIPTSIHRIVFGRDFETDQSLTDKLLEAQPLVRAIA
jgi:hypothetical protein